MQPEALTDVSPDEVHAFIAAALPPHSAESLWLSVPDQPFAGGCASDFRGVASAEIKMPHNGKAEPYRTVLRQSRLILIRTPIDSRT